MLSTIVIVGTLLGQAPPPGPAAVPLPAEAYKGMAPGSTAKNPLPPPKKTDPTQLVWTGFKMVGDKSQVFLQTTRELTFEVGTPSAAKKGGKASLSVFLRNCRIHLRNNQRPLDTRYFATPVIAFKARQKRKDVELTFQLKEPATAVPRTESGPDGTQFLVLEFPPGRAATPPDPSDAPPDKGVRAGRTINLKTTDSSK